MQAAIVPMSPLLFRHLSGAADPVPGLREQAVRAVQDVIAEATDVLVLCPVGGREAPADWHDPSGASTSRGSLAAQVGEHLLALAGCALPATYAVVPGEVPEPGPGTALVVLGDGAAARSQPAPGHIDERSFPYDDLVASLLADGDGDGLTRLDASLGAELMATGRHSWPVLGRLVRAADAELRHREDPFGLTSFVAVWRSLDR